MQDPNSGSMESSLSDHQERVISVLRIVGATLSVFGSSIVVSRVLRTNRSKLGPYHRIMLVLSSCDLIMSISLILSPFLVPKETSSRVWASGTDITCSFIGWLIQVGTAGVCYNGVLSFYFLATIRHGIKPDEFAARYEPFFVLIVFYFIFTATAGVPFDMYGEFQLNIGCWVKNDYGCDEDGNGCIGKMIAWAYAGLPVMFTITMIPINYFRIYRHVNQNLRILGDIRTSYAAQVAHIRRLATQGFLYVGAFFLSYIPQLALRIVDVHGQHGPSNEHEIYPLLIVLSVFFPLAGLFNMLVFIRPDYIRLRFAGFSMLESMKKAMFSNDIPKLTETTNATRTNQNSKSQELGPEDHSGHINNMSQYQRLNADISSQGDAPQDESWADDTSDELKVIKVYKDSITLAGSEESKPSAQM